MTTYPIPTDVVTPCAADPDRMFPTKGVAPRKVAEAKKVCGPCEYQADCLEWALANAEEGVWAGTDEKDRAAIHKARGTVGKRPMLTGLVRQGIENAKVQHGTSVGIEVHRRRYQPLCDLCVEFDTSRKGKTPPVPCPDCGLSLLPQSVRKHRRTACPVREQVAS